MQVEQSVFFQAHVHTAHDCVRRVWNASTCSEDKPYTYTHRTHANHNINNLNVITVSMKVWRYIKTRKMMQTPVHRPKRLSSTIVLNCEWTPAFTLRTNERRMTQRLSSSLWRLRQIVSLLSVLAYCAAGDLVFSKTSPPHGSTIELELNNVSYHTLHSVLVALIQS